MKLKNRILNAGAWTLLAYSVENVFRLASSLILSRLLFPEAFGLVSASSSIIVGVALFSDLGIRAVIIRSPRGDTQEFLRSAWLFQALRGMSLWLVVVLICTVIALPVVKSILPPGSAFANDLFPILTVALGFTLVIGGLESTSIFFKSSTVEVSISHYNGYCDQDRDHSCHDWLRSSISKRVGARGRQPICRCCTDYSVTHDNTGPANGLELEYGSFSRGSPFW